MLSLLLVGAATLAADPGYYARRATWQETLRESREALARFEEEEAKKPKPAADPNAPQLGPWYAIGPFHKEGKTSFAAVFPPEEEIDLGKQYEEGKLRWVKRPEWQDGIVTMLSAGSQSATYLTRAITVKRPVTITGYFGSDDGLTVWLNGKRILANDVPRGPGPNQDKAALALKAGENCLLLKISNITGGHGFYFSTSDKPVKDNAREEARARLWDLVRRDFSEPAQRLEMRREQADRIWEGDWEAGEWANLAKRYAGAIRVTALAPEARRLTAAARDAEGLRALRALYHRSRHVDETVAALRGFSAEALRLAVDDLARTHGERYPKGKEYRSRLDLLERSRGDVLAEAEKGGAEGVERAARLVADLDALRREALLANPLLDFERVLLVRRRENRLGLPQNWQGNSSIPRAGYDNEIAVLPLRSPDGKAAALFRPEGGKFVGDLDLHWDGERVLFSMPAANNRWQLFEIRADGSGLRQVTPGDQPDVDNFDGCYLPNGKVMFCSTACFQGVPCVGGGDHVANLYLLDPATKAIRQLSFDQDHNWCPTVMNNGKVLYTRWEYSDTPHYFTRILFHMNPDGTEQMEYYGSNSYWPNSLFYARPIPGHPTQVVAIVSGHHGVPRMGELVLFDPARGRREGEGAAQRIPGYGKKVDAVIQDQLVNASWPRFLHPFPISDKHFLVSCKPDAASPWGIYLVDIFDNMLPLAAEEDYALLEPIPVRKSPAPRVVPEKVRPERKDGLVYLADIYAGDGLKGVPRGAVRALRVYANHYAYPGMGGHIHIGIDGPWDAKRILGTVPVHPDGSALFRVPANTPLVVQPLDAEGKALQVMRSWMTAMPGETLSCVGCHESQSSTPPARNSLAARRKPDAIRPWYGPARGFSFEREVQPVLDRHCVPCHGADAAPPAPQLWGGPKPPAPQLWGGPKPPAPPTLGGNGGAAGALPAPPTLGGNGGAIPVGSRRRPDLRGLKGVAGYKGRFTPAYEALHPYVRRPGPESDYHLPNALEFHADTSELVQMLRKGHHGVKLDPESWDRLITWIDLNVPCHGTWREHKPIPHKGDERRRTLRALYAGMDEDPEAIPPLRISDFGFRNAASTADGATAIPDRSGDIRLLAGPGNPRSAIRNPQSVPGWPFDAAEAKRQQSALGEAEVKVDLGGGVTLEMMRIPAGEFVMGDAEGMPDEQPISGVRIERSFLMGKLEVTNEQFGLFDPAHDSGYASHLNKDQTQRGYPLNGPKQPAVRVSWEQADAFCRWLSAKTGRRFRLPTEAEWEYACRAGTSSPLAFGALDTDFSRSANLADATLSRYQRRDSPDWILKEARFTDGAMVTADAGRYQANAWGLHDMHGNACEWTATTYAPYPYRGNGAADGPKVARGGSWYDRPHRARSAFRLSYPTWQKVYNVGIRVVCEE